MCNCTKKGKEIPLPPLSRSKKINCSCTKYQHVDRPFVTATRKAVGWGGWGGVSDESKGSQMPFPCTQQTGSRQYQSMAIIAHLSKNSESLWDTGWLIEWLTDHLEEFQGEVKCGCVCVCMCVCVCVHYMHVCVAIKVAHACLCGYKRAGQDHCGQ